MVHASACRSACLSNSGRLNVPAVGSPGRRSHVAAGCCRARGHHRGISSETPAGSCWPLTVMPGPGGGAGVPRGHLVLIRDRAEEAGPKDQTTCFTYIELSAPTAWSRRFARFWPIPCPTRLRLRSPRCQRAGWSGGWPSGCRTGSGRGMGVVMGCARMSGFRRRGGSLGMRLRRRLGSMRMRIRGCRSGRSGLCSRWLMGVWGSRGWRAWLRI
jgi:hypothetical protein